MRACLTGSRVYGTPRHDSDLDCVILVENQEDMNLLVWSQDFNRSANNNSFFMDENAGQGYCGKSLRFGNMNVIAVLRDERVFEAWRVGTDFLRQIKPVTKEQACLVLESMFKVAQAQSTGNSASTPVGI